MATPRVLELVHMDLMRPTRVESIGHKRYILVVVDDFSVFTWVKFLREKSETFETFKNLLNQNQVEQGLNIGKIKRIRSDHGREFENQEFSNFCDELGIKHGFFANKTPQQNGVVKRNNRFLP